MKKPAAILGSALFLVVAPGTLAVFVPWLLTRWQMHPAFFDQVAIRYLGGVLIVCGACVLLECFWRFVVDGFGTPAPVAPPTKLVVSGLYRYTRNPMYVGIVSIVLGQALWFGSTRTIIYAASLWLLFHVWVLIYEQSALRASFPEEYREYCRNVPMWIPRLSAWQKPD